MSTSIEKLHKEIMNLRKDVNYIKSLISEDFELSNHAKKKLKEARETPESEYIEL